MGVKKHINSTANSHERVKAQPGFFSDCRGPLSGLFDRGKLKITSDEMKLVVFMKTSKNSRAAENNKKIKWTKQQYRTIWSYGYTAIFLL